MTKEFGEKLDELLIKYQSEGRDLWEQRLALYVKPKPKFMPRWVYNLLIKLVFQQTLESKIL